MFAQKNNRVIKLKIENSLCKSFYVCKQTQRVIINFRFKAQEIDRSFFCIFSQLVDTKCFSFLTICACFWRQQWCKRCRLEEAGPRPCQPFPHFHRLNGGFGKVLQWILSITGVWKLWFLDKQTKYWIYDGVRNRSDTEFTCDISFKPLELLQSWFLLVERNKNTHC